MAIIPAGSIGKKIRGKKWCIEIRVSFQIRIPAAGGRQHPFASQSGAVEVLIGGRVQPGAVQIQYDQGTLPVYEVAQRNALRVAVVLRRIIAGVIVGRPIFPLIALFATVLVDERNRE